MMALPLRVMHIVLDMDLGGLQRVVNLLLKNRDKDIILPYLVCLDRAGAFADDLKGQVEVKVLKRRPGPFDFRLLMSLYRLIKQLKIDVVHSHNACAPYATLAGRLAGVGAIIHTDHGRLVPDTLTSKLEDRLSSLLMDRFVAVSQELEEYLSTCLKIRQAKLATIINGVDITQFSPLSSSERIFLRERMGIHSHNFVLGTACRLDPIKNLEFLLRSVGELVKANPNIRLLIAGDGPEEKKLRAYVEANGLSQAVMFLGRIREMNGLLAAFDAYVCTSLSEGTSMTILEAMACGLPIVASNVGGNRRLVNSLNGMLFPSNDKEAFEKCIVQLCKDKELVCKMGEQSRKRVEREFSFEKTLRAYEHLYTSLCLVA